MRPARPSDFACCIKSSQPVCPVTGWPSALLFEVSNRHDDVDPPVDLFQSKPPVAGQGHDQANDRAYNHHLELFAEPDISQRKVSAAGLE